MKKTKKKKNSLSSGCYSKTRSLHIPSGGIQQLIFGKRSFYSSLFPAYSYMPFKCLIRIDYYMRQALVFPPVLELITFWPNVGRWTLTKNSLIIVFGIIGFLAGTYASVESLVDAFST